MSRAALKPSGSGKSSATILAAFLLAAAATAQSGSLLHPHLDPGIVLTGCSGCHRGHGAPGSPMLPEPLAEVCLSCHDTEFRREDQVALGILAPGVRPPLIGPVLNKPFTHPLDRRAFSSANGVTCTSCHTPHRTPVPLATGSASTLGRRDRSEAEICGGCHRNFGPFGLSTFTSYHPVGAPATERSPSVVPELSGQQINCTDCHDNDDPKGPRGPHGSNLPSLLGAEYTVADNVASANYGLCFQCHREEVLIGPEGEEFSLHAEHVVEQRAACSTCHSPHGSVQNRALIHIGEGGFFFGVSPSASGILSFESQVPGQGRCYLTCHGFNHDPESYGVVPAALSPRLEP